MAFNLEVLGKKPEYIKKQEDLNIEKAGGSYIPSISVLSTQAKQINKQDDKYIKGAEAGDLIITSPNPVLIKADKGMEIIPALYRPPYYIVWSHLNVHKLDKLGNRKGAGSRTEKHGEYETMEEALANCTNDTMVPVKTIDYLVFSPSYVSKDNQEPIILRFDKPSNYRLADDFGETLNEKGNVSAIKWRLTSDYIKNVDNPYYTFKFDPIEYSKPKDFEAITELAKVVKPGFLGLKSPSNSTEAPQLTNKIM